MRLSQFTISHLAKAVCGDSYYTPYLRGFELVSFFNQFGYNEEYGAGFPSRWLYAEEKLKELNNTPSMKDLVENIADPRRFFGIDLDVEEAVVKLNEALKFDKFRLVKSGNLYKVISLGDKMVEAESSKAINHEFMSDQIDKCMSKINDEDFKGAITNARSLIEAIFIEIIERHEGIEIRNEGDLENQWKQVKKIIRLEMDKETMPDYVIQILSGLNSAIKGLAGLSNNAADRHANKFKTRKHHAKLAVNLSMTISDFLLDSWDFQTNAK